MVHGIQKSCHCSRLGLGEQQKIFNPGKGRRIIIATNVAETALTVPNIRYVIDSGFARISRYSYRSRVQRCRLKRYRKLLQTSVRGAVAVLRLGSVFVCIVKKTFKPARIYRT